LPLAFHSSSHGVVAFGFFHIETPMLLLEELFFFAPEFCDALVRLAQSPPERDWRGGWPGFVIADPRCRGDLHGAIAGRDLEGFIGALYARWPFPRDPHQFRQRTRGAAPREVVEQEAGRFGRQEEIPFTARAGGREFAIGQYRFHRAGFLALVDYLWRGGMPGWEGGRRPEWLLEAARRIQESDSPWLAGLDWDPARLGFII